MIAPFVLVVASLAAGNAGGATPPRPPSSTASRPAAPGDTAAATRNRFLQMFARAYFPGRTGHLLIVPRAGDFITRPDPNYLFMHGSPWEYDTAIPMMFVGPAVKAGIYTEPARQQDVAPTIAAVLGVRMPPTATGRSLPILRPGFAPPRAVLLLVLDGMRRDYFDRYREAMPTLSSLRRQGAWFSAARIDVLPTNTAVGHSTIATGADPSVHGITGTSVYDRAHGRRHDAFAEDSPEDLMALTLSDVWQLATSGRAIVLAQGSIERAAAPLAGHGACQLNGAPVVLASYDLRTGLWSTDPDCFRLPDYLKTQSASTLWSSGPEWMGHRIDSTSAVRHSGLFPAFEADAMVAMIEREPIGADDVPDLILMNYKSADFVGHKHGPDSEEMRVTLEQMDRHLKRILDALAAKVGSNVLLAVTADHGMPPEPPSAGGRHLVPSIVDLLHARFDPDEKRLIKSYDSENAQIFVDEERLKERGLTLRDLADVLQAQPYIFAAFTRDEVRAAHDALRRESSQAPAGTAR